MKLNKKKLWITILIISVIILSLFCYLINTNENYKDNLTMNIPWFVYLCNFPSTTISLLKLRRLAK
mgnify:CR=1 FL=1